MRAAAEIGKISLGIKSDFAIMSDPLTDPVYIHHPFSVKYLMASGFEISFRV